MVVDLTGRVAVVTGSTKGIGRAAARALAGAGASVVVSSRTEADVRSTAGELDDALPGSVHGIPCDVRERADCEALIEGVVERFGHLDILVNNAGLGRFAPIQEMEPETWDLQIRTNLDGVFHCSRAAVPHLVRDGGWIINIGSLAGRNAFGGGVAYNASKFGLVGMSEAMMLDLRHEGVRVTCIMPGSVNTHFFDEGGPDPEKDWRLHEDDIARVIMDLLAFPDRALPSKIEIRPSRPPRK